VDRFPDSFEAVRAAERLDDASPQPN